MGKKPSYDKLVLSAYERCEVDLVLTLKEYYESLLCLKRYFKGVPWESIKPENKPALEEVIDQFMHSVDEEVKDRIMDYWRMHTPRYRPIYERVLEYILTNKDVLESVATEYWRKRTKIYREIAEDLGISWRTVRDAFWSFRRAGILE